MRTQAHGLFRATQIHGSNCLINAEPSAADVLFLHGGPGFNAGMERLRYGRTLPVDWWDQPSVEAGTTAPFAKGVDAAAMRLAQLAARRGAPVALLASSFGTWTAFELLRRAPGSISSVTLSGPVYGLRACFVLLGRRLAQARSDETLLSLAGRAEIAAEDESFWALIGHVAGLEGFTDVYWAPASQAQRLAMRALLTDGRLMHMPTFQAVLHEVIRAAPPPLPVDSRVPIRVLLGRHDPCMTDDTAHTWRAWLPRAQVEVVEAGHFPHLELPPEDWLRQARASDRTHRPLAPHMLRR